MVTITGIKKDKIIEILRRNKKMVNFDLLQQGQLFSIQVNGKEVIPLSEEEIIFVHDKYRQAYKKPCVDDLMERIEELEDELILKDSELDELEEKYDSLVNWALKAKQTKEELEKDNRELVSKFYFLQEELNDWKEICKELKGESYDR